MRDRREEIKKRIAARKKQKLTVRPTSGETTNFSPRYEMPIKTNNDSPPIVPNHEEPIHPLFRKEVFALKILIAACLVLAVAILFKNESAKFEPARVAVKNVMEKEFQFATVADWYESTFGKPLALFPKQNPLTEEKERSYALPASAKIVENFDKDNQGVTIQTVINAPVETIQSGKIIFAGEKETTGKTVIVQHKDNSQAWYGQLSEINVKVYQEVSPGEKLGIVSPSEDEFTGQFYFAIKKDEQFIDPIQVIKFE
ncbi:M23 family metallopeptidase [Bacillus kwashiorkori]|uniref:M23 family metallopeptidase n=1 Tax=Bacillus kwashiorkori TaxID=1522318 RepID=UPI000783BECD|nr:M23 family metallopeptidase [Bacillus kwashiorkori]